MNLMFCPECGASNDEDADFCRECGSKLNTNILKINKPTLNPEKYKDPGLAGVFSAIFPGFGQIYNEELWKGIILFVIALFIAVPFLSFIINNSAVSRYYGDFYTGLSFIFFLCVIPYVIVWLIGVRDAQKSAKRFNKQH